MLREFVEVALLRPEHDEPGYEAFLERLREARALARDAEPFTAANVAVGENISHMLRALYAGLAAVEKLPPHTQRARDATLRVLARP